MDAICAITPRRNLSFHRPVVGRPGPPKMESLLDMPQWVQSIPRPLAWGGLIASNALAAATSLDLGAIAGGISLVGGAAVALYVLGAREIAKVRAENEKVIAQAKAEALKTLDAANKESLSAQLEEVNNQLHKARESLHAIRNEWNNEKTRLTSEIERLTEELHATRDELHASRLAHRDSLAAYQALLMEIRGTKARIADNAERITKLEDRPPSGEVPVP